MLPTLSTTASVVVSPRQGRVLLVDGALPVRRKMMEILARAGVQPTALFVATDAESALEIFAREHPPLVFAELVGETAQAGLELVLELLALDPQVKVVLVTSEDPAGTIVRTAVRQGVFAVVPKPVRHDKIRQILYDIENEDGGIERFR